MVAGWKTRIGSPSGDANLTELTEQELGIEEARLCYKISDLSHLRRQIQELTGQPIQVQEGSGVVDMCTISDTQMKYDAERPLGLQIMEPLSRLERVVEERHARENPEKGKAAIAEDVKEELAKLAISAIEKGYGIN